MKRSEMIEFIKDELFEIAESYTVNEFTDKYFTRKAAGLLCMIEGFGMLPPERKVESTKKLGAAGPLIYRIHCWDEEE